MPNPFSILIVCGNCAGEDDPPRFTERTRDGKCASCESTSWIPATVYGLNRLDKKHIARLKGEIMRLNLLNGALKRRTANKTRNLAEKKIAKYRMLRMKLASKLTQ